MITLTATAPFKVIPTLSHGQQVRIPGAMWCKAITVHTVRGSEEQDLREMKRTPEDQIPAMAAANIQERVDRWAARGEVYPLAPFTMQAPAVLTADYPGKAEKLAAEQAAFEAAIMLEDGQRVLIDGEEWLVCIVGLEFSDPIHFVKKAAA